VYVFPLTRTADSKLGGLLFAFGVTTISAALAAALAVALAAASAAALVAALAAKRDPIPIVSASSVS
jgi:hypothetical protein